MHGEKLEVTLFEDQIIKQTKIKLNIIKFKLKEKR